MTFPTIPDLPIAPANSVIGWYGASLLLNRPSDSLKSSFNRGQLNVHPIKVGGVLFFDIDELNALKEKTLAQGSRVGRPYKQF